MAPSFGQTVSYGRRSSLPAFPVSHAFSQHRHQAIHSQHPLHNIHQNAHQLATQEQDHPQSTYPLSHSLPGDSSLSTEMSDDSTFSSFSQIITHHAPNTFTAPLSPVPLSSSSPTTRRMSAPNINLFVIVRKLV